MMNSKGPIALAIGTGYLLGRNHRMTWALALGAAAASGQLNGVASRLRQQGTQALPSTPEFDRFSETATKLVEAGRGALTAAVSSRATAVADRLESRAARMAPPRGDTDDRSGQGDEDEEQQEPDEAEDGEAAEDDGADEDDEAEGEGAAAEDDEADEDDEGAESGDSEDRPVRAHARPTRNHQRSPVVRRPRG